MSSLEKYWPPPWFCSFRGLRTVLRPTLILPQTRQIPRALALHYLFCLAIWPLWVWQGFRNRRPPSRVLWIGRFHLGDFLLTVPALAILRRELPDAWIGVILQRRYQGTLKLPCADAELPEIQETLSFSAQVTLWVRRYRELRIDTAVFHRFTRPDLPALVAAVLVRLPHRVGGVEKGIQALLTDIYAPSGREKVALYSRNLVASWLRLPAQPSALAWPEILPVEAGANREWDILIAPFAQHTKIWPPEHWREILDALEARSLRVALSASPSAVETARDLLRDHPWVINLAERNTSPADFYADVASSRGVICVDTGIRHVAAALGVPCLVLGHGREHHRLFGAYVPTERYLFNPVPCAPCGEEPCPLGHLQCVRGITPREVLQALREILPDETSSSEHAPSTKVFPQNNG